MSLTSGDKSKGWAILANAPVWPIAFLVFCAGFSGEIGAILSSVGDVLAAWAVQLEDNNRAIEVLNGLGERMDALEDASP